MIDYKEIKKIDKDQLQKLFTAVDWGPIRNPDLLVTAIENSECVISAWDKKQLVGIANVLSDQIKTVYIHYVLVHENYQNKGIGKAIISMALNKYEHCQHFILISSNESIDFFKGCGFKICEKAAAMEIRK